MLHLVDDLGRIIMLPRTLGILLNNYDLLYRVANVSSDTLVHDYINYRYQYQ